MQNQMRAAVPAQPSVQFMKFQISLLEETQRANTHLRASLRDAERRAAAATATAEAAMAARERDQADNERVGTPRNMRGSHRQIHG